MATKTKTAKTTYELFIHGVRDIVISYARTEGVVAPETLDRLGHTKLLYGIGEPGVRGVCHYSAWQNGVGNVDVVEIAASTQESWIQLAGTTIHELAHVLAGAGHGHDLEWKDAAVALGFTKRPDAAGQVYRLALFAPAIRYAVYELAAKISDGTPAFYTYGSGLAGLLAGIKLRPCSAGVGTKGGKSRGTGSGSRLRLWECECVDAAGKPKPVKVRVASDHFQAHCDVCGAPFTRK